jgi:two-component system LytT family response regulator
MILRAIIIDDEPRGVSALKSLIEEYMDDVNVVAESTNPADAIPLIHNYKPEIVFLDINMPEMSGFDLLDRLLWKNFNLIFTTAHEEYALRALKNNAVDYILKPIDHEEVQAAITKIKARIGKAENDISLNYARLVKDLSHYHKSKVLVSLKSGIEAIAFNDILYLESQSNYTQLYLVGSKVILTAKPLKEFEDELCLTNQSFMRVHHSFIINLNKVSRYLRSEEQILLDDNYRIPLSKSKKDKFYSWLQL